MTAPRITTHIPFLDQVLGGGHGSASVNGILGPTGIGKTHLATMIAANGATRGPIFGDKRSELFDTLLAARPSRWVFFDLHSPCSRGQDRLVSHVAKIKRENVCERSEAIQSFEKERKSELVDRRGKLLSSEARCHNATSLLNQKLAYFPEEWCDEFGLYISPSDMEFIIRHELADLKRQQEKVAGVVIDGVNSVWNRVWNTYSGNERDFIHNFVSDFCRDICKRYQCPVWVTHQLSGKASDAPPSKAPSHRDAAYCKTFADNLDACVVLGTHSVPDGVFSIQCTKGYPGMDVPPRLLLKHHPHFSSIVEAPDFVEDPKNQTWKKPITPQEVVGDHVMKHIQELKEKHRKRSSGKEVPIGAVN